MSKFLEYIVQNQSQILSLLMDHIKLTCFAVALAILIGVPLGLLISYVKKLNKLVLGMASVIQAVPSMALLGFAIPFLGIGVLPSVLVVILYSLLPIVKNTFTGIQGISPELMEAAKGIGLTKTERLFRVQLPLAMPVIMAGIRISAVTAVGLMTMAAFIGGGGLGYLVFSGISTVNNSQILAGAIPACLLALLVDFLLGLLEKVLVSKSQGNGEDKSQRNRRLGILAVSGILIVIFIVISGIRGANGSGERTLIVGGKNYTEQRLLCELASQAIEKETDIKVNRKNNLGGTQVIFNAMKGGEVDLYIEYTGTAYTETLGYLPISDVEEVFKTVKQEFKDQYGMDVLDQMAFNNTYTLAVLPEFAEEHNLKTFSDLAAMEGEVRIASTLEFMNREDGLPGLKKTYGMKFAEETGIDGALRYTAITNDECDVIDAFSTDGLLEKFQLTVLEDDKDFFPPYYPVPVIRESVYEEYPELKDVFDKLGPLLTEEAMKEMNYQIDELQRDEKSVAGEFLEEHGFGMEE